MKRLRDEFKTRSCRTRTRARKSRRRGGGGDALEVRAKMVLMIGQVELWANGRRVMEFRHAGDDDARGQVATADDEQEFDVRLAPDADDVAGAELERISGDTMLVVYPTAAALGHFPSSHLEPRYLGLPEGALEIHFLADQVTRQNGHDDIDGCRYSVKRIGWSARPYEDNDYAQGDGDVFEVDDEETAEARARERTQYFLGLMQQIEEYRLFFDARIIVLREEDGCLYVDVQKHKFVKMGEALRAIVYRYRCVFVYDRLAFVLGKQRNFSICRTGQEAVDLLRRVARSLFPGPAIPMSAAQFERFRRNLLRQRYDNSQVWREPVGTTAAPVVLAATVLEEARAQARAEAGADADDEMDGADNGQTERIVPEASTIDEDLSPLIMTVDNFDHNAYGIFHSTETVVTVVRDGEVLRQIDLADVRVGDRVRTAPDVWSPVTFTFTRECDETHGMMDLVPRLLTPAGNHHVELGDTSLGGVSFEYRQNAVLAIVTPPITVVNNIVRGVIAGETRAGAVALRRSEITDADGRARRVETIVPFNLDGGIVDPDEALARANELIRVAQEAGENLVLADPQPPGQAVSIANVENGIVHAVPHGRAAWTCNGLRLATNLAEYQEYQDMVRAQHVNGLLRSARSIVAEVAQRNEQFAEFGRVHRQHRPNGDVAVAAMPPGSVLKAWGDFRIDTKLEPALPTISKLSDDFENEPFRLMVAILNELTPDAAVEILWAVGLWLGDGTINTLLFAVGDAEADVILPVLSRVGDLREYRRNHNDAVGSYAMSVLRGGGHRLRRLLRVLGVFEEKFISREAMLALRSLSVPLRTAFLSGLIDSDGTGTRGTIVELDVVNVVQSLNGETRAWSHESILTAFCVVAQSLELEVYYSERWAVYTKPIYATENHVHEYHHDQQARRAAADNARVRCGRALIRGDSIVNFPIRLADKKTGTDRNLIETGHITSSSGFLAAETRAPRRGERVTCLVVNNSCGFFADNGYWCQTIADVAWNDPTNRDAPNPFGWLRREAWANAVIYAARRVADEDDLLD